MQGLIFGDFFLTWSSSLLTSHADSYLSCRDSSDMKSLDLGIVLVFVYLDDI
ncbi:hypothetical protein Bca101_067755 [Brassica carinata]